MQQNVTSDGPSEPEIAALKRLSSFVIVDDDDAANVIDVINSLTQTYLLYKTRNLSPPVRELLCKSLKNGSEGLECILKCHGVENIKPLEKFTDINNATTRCASNVLRQFSSKWKEDTKNVSMRNKTDSSFDEVNLNANKSLARQKNELASLLKHDQQSTSIRNSLDVPNDSNDASNSSDSLKPFLYGQTKDDCHSTGSRKELSSRNSSSNSFCTSQEQTHQNWKWDKDSLQGQANTVSNNLYGSNRNTPAQSTNSPSIVDLFKSYRNRT